MKNIESYCNRNNFIYQTWKKTNRAKPEYHSVVEVDHRIKELHSCTRAVQKLLATPDSSPDHQGDNREKKHQWIQAVITQERRKLTPQFLFDNTPTHYQSFKDTFEEKFFENLKRCDDHP
ncbi:uncharacterized protein LOC144432087 [Styela clava]